MAARNADAEGPALRTGRAGYLGAMAAGRRRGPGHPGLATPGEAPLGGARNHHPFGIRPLIFRTDRDSASARSVLALHPRRSRRNLRCPCPTPRPSVTARAATPNGTAGPGCRPPGSIPGARRHPEPARSGLVLLAGLAVTFAAIATTTAAAFLAGTAVAGVGVGLALLGVNRTLIALAAPGQRAGLISAIFIISFLGLSIPVVIAGVATAHFGLHRTALAYCVAMAALVAVAAGSLMLRRRGPATGQG